MKKLIFAFIFITALLLGVAYREPITTKVASLLLAAPCDTPIRYSIGTVDNRFNLSKEDFLTDIQAAEKIWSTAYGKQLFVYDADAPFTINLIYDERQSLQNQINQLDTNLQTQDQALKPQIEEYEQKVADFNTRVTDLNQQIDSWNEKGGAPEDVYNQLVAEQESLQQEEQALQTLGQSLGQSTDAYNQQIEQLGETVDTFNEALTDKPEQGLYVQEGNERKILIYLTNSEEELIHTLAHEFGHALGIEHIANPQSIMHAKTNEIISPTTEDKKALAMVCKKVTVFEKLATNFSTLYAQMLTHKRTQ